MKIEIRKATADDCDFLSQIIFHAESTGFEITSYETMFARSAEDLQPIFSRIINNPTKGHPLCYDSYFIATVDGESAAALSAYIEGAEGSSNHIMTGVLMSGFNRDDIKKAFAFLAKHKTIQIPKTSGSLQLDCIATFPAFYNMGLFSRLLNHVETLYLQGNTNTVEIQVWKKNHRAVNLYHARGYAIKRTNMSDIIIDNGKVLMQKEI